MLVSTAGWLDDWTGVERARMQCRAAMKDEYDSIDTASAIDCVLGRPLDEYIMECVLAEFAKRGVACSGVACQRQECCAPVSFGDRGMSAAASGAAQRKALPACLFCGCANMGCEMRCAESAEALTLVKRGERRRRENFFREQALA